MPQEDSERTNTITKKITEYETSDSFKSKFEILSENTELAKLYNDLVVTEQCVTHDEFFLNYKDYQEGMKLRRIEEQENPKNTDFYLPKRREREKGEELVFMKYEDKLFLLDQHPQLKKIYQDKFGGQFEDMQEEEIRWWDKFWTNQKEGSTLLYGVETKDTKGLMMNLPIFNESKAGA